MNKKTYKTGISGIVSWAAGAVVFCAVLYIVLTGLSGAGKATSEEGIKLASDSIRRAAVTCYAAEGVYPDSYEYIKEHYGISVDENKYLIDYSIFAENIMPDIFIKLREGGSG